MPYRVSVRKIPGTEKVDFRLKFNSPTGATNACTFIACAMIRLNRPDISMPQYIANLSWLWPGPTEWSCTRSGNVNRPPSYHFGCAYVTVPVGAKNVYAHKTIADLKGVVPNPPDAWTQADLNAVYWDALQNYPMKAGSECGPPGPGPFGVVNVNASPSNSDIITNYANIWGGNSTCAEKLLTQSSGGQKFVARQDTGNWFTMTYPSALSGGTYPVTLSLEASGGPGVHPDGTYTFIMDPGTVLGTLTVSGGVASPLNIDMDLAVRSPSMTIKFQSNGPVPSGTMFGVRGTVTARQDIPVMGANGTYVPYHAGQFMYALDQGFMADDDTPVISSVFTSGGGSGLTVYATASDATSSIAYAYADVTLADGTSQRIPLTYLGGDEQSTFNFSGQLPSNTVSYSVTCADECDNLATRACTPGTPGCGPAGT
jgi:hypothetical protein